MTSSTAMCAHWGMPIPAPLAPLWPPSLWEAVCGGRVVEPWRSPQTWAPGPLLLPRRAAIEGGGAAAAASEETK